MTQERRRHERDGHRRHDPRDLGHELASELFDGGGAFLAPERPEIDAAAPDVFFQRHRGAKVDAGVTEAVPLVSREQPEIAQQELRHLPDGRERPGWRRLGVELAKKAAVLEDAVVVDPDRHEDDVALAGRIEGAGHVVEDPELGPAQAPVARKASLGKDRLRDAGLRRHGDVALEDLAVERVPGAPPHEVRPHRADERLERPDARPLADRVGERGFLGRQVRHQDVVHVAAVVDEKHDR